MALIVEGDRRLPAKAQPVVASSMIGEWSALWTWCLLGTPQEQVYRNRRPEAPSTTMPALCSSPIPPSAATQHLAVELRIISAHSKASDSAGPFLTMVEPSLSIRTHS